MQYEELEKKNSIRSWALDLCNKDAGIGNSVNFIKYLRNKSPFQTYIQAEHKACNEELKRHS